MTEKEEFILAVQSALRFLPDELGFAPPSVSHDRHGAYEYTGVKYQNEHVTVRIEAGWHYRDTYLKMVLAPRSGFSIPVRSRRSGRLLHVRDGFSIEELAEALAPDVTIPRKASRKELLQVYAGLLSKHGRAILRGDFGPFPLIKAASKRNIVRTDPNWMPAEDAP